VQQVARALAAPLLRARGEQPLRAVVAHAHGLLAELRQLDLVLRAPVAHDARGKRRSTSRIRIVLLLVLLIIVVVTYLFTIGLFGKLQWRWPVPDTTPALSDSPTAPDGADPQAGE
ncbi:MAG: hypothetical protein QF735_01115, partial [Phycisphaeraceae bacterium]|nr:hypothetical protein [Phycisphaeraceae bacterium]